MVHTSRGDAARRTAPFVALALSVIVSVAPAHATKTRPAPAPPPYAAYRIEAHTQLVGTKADCYDYAARAYALLQAEKIPVRLVVVAASDNLYDTHTFIEVKSSSGRWAIQDPTFNGWWSIDGHAASAADLQGALAHGRDDAVLWHGPAAELTQYYVNPLLLFRTVRYEHIDAHGTAIVDSTRTIALPDTYYASASSRDSIAQVMVIQGGSDWHVGSYTLMHEANGDWVSPIAILRGLQPTGDGTGTVQLLNVSRFPADQVAR